MKANSWYLIAFGAMVLLQLLVPGRMILQSEKDLQKGTMYKFLVSPVDPNDPFRGKFLTLEFRANTVRAGELEAYGKGSPVFVSVREDGQGFAEAYRVSRVKPEGTADFVEAKVAGIDAGIDETILTVEYPFNRYFVNEKKAPEIEKAFQQASAEDDQDTYAVVRVRNGRGLLEDLVINGTSVKNE